MAFYIPIRSISHPVNSYSLSLPIPIPNFVANSHSHGIPTQAVHCVSLSLQEIWANAHETRESL